MIQLMIADDERIERFVLRKTLDKYLGDICQIYEAENGRQALALYREKHIQIAILDIEMPGINGIQAAEEIRRCDPDCCIIFLTAFDDFHYARQAVHVRAMEYLLKPYTERELLDVLDEAVRLTRRRPPLSCPQLPHPPKLPPGQKRTRMKPMRKTVPGYSSSRRPSPIMSAGIIKTKFPCRMRRKR